jgi:AcrR family transcriptional regulator
MNKSARSRKQPVQKRSRETVETIYEAAAQIFSHLGYAAATTDKIAERAGVSIGSLYQYFPNKEAIVTGLMARHMQLGQEALVEVIASGIKDGIDFKRLLSLIIAKLVAFHEKDPGLMRVFLSELTHHQELMRKGKAMTEYFTGMVEMLIRSNPAARVKSPKVAAHLVTIAAEALTHEIVCYHYDEFTPEEFVEELTQMLYRYLFLEDPARVSGNLDEMGHTGR